MGTNIVVPNLGESIIEATIAHWFKKTGEHVDVGEPLVELETDKVNLEVGAEQAGVLAEISHQEGEDVKVGEVLGRLDPGGAQPPPQEKAAQRQAAVPAEPAPANPPSNPSEEEQSQENRSQEEKATPVARRYALDQGVNIEEISGSGPGGRVVRQDIDNFVRQKNPPSEKDLSTRSTPDVQPARQPTPAAHPAPPLQVPSDNQAGMERQEERVKMSRRRRTIAQRLVEAQHTAAMLTTFNDVDMGAVMDIRQRRKQSFKDKYGVSLGIVSFFVKASILALRDFPQINAEIQGEEIVYKSYFDIGVAIGAQEGLVVPVLRNADQMTFAEIEKGIQGFVKKSNEGALTLEDLQGGTFTITNGGVFGSLMSTPILNFPQAAILGLHRIEDRPVVRDGQVTVRPMMYLAVSYDHRIVDGREAVQFLARIKDAIENPEMILLEG